MAKRTIGRIAWGLAIVMAGSLYMGRSVAAHGEGQGAFADVPIDHPALDAVNELASRGLITGYPDGTFGGHRALTRNEIAVVVPRMFHPYAMPEPAGSDWPLKPVLGPPFREVLEEHWAVDGVSALRKAGLIMGYPDATFGGDRPLTRYEFAVFLHRLRELMFWWVDRRLEQYRKAGEPFAALPAPAPELKITSTIPSAKEAPQQTR